MIPLRTEMSKGESTPASPIAHEIRVRGNLAGRATVAQREDLRADFELRLASLLVPSEAVEQIVALRAFDSGRTPQPEGVVVLTDRAIMWLHAAQGDIAAGYGVRAVTIPCSKIVAVELSQRLLRGLFVLRASAEARLEVEYHVLDEELFAKLARAVRVRASEVP